MTEAARRPFVDSLRLERVAQSWLREGQHLLHFLRLCSHTIISMYAFGTMLFARYFEIEVEGTFSSMELLFLARLTAFSRTSQGVTSTDEVPRL